MKSLWPFPCQLRPCECFLSYKGPLTFTFPMKALLPLPFLWRPSDRYLSYEGPLTVTFSIKALWPLPFLWRPSDPVWCRPLLEPHWPPWGQECQLKRTASQDRDQIQVRRFAENKLRRIRGYFLHILISQRNKNYFRKYLNIYCKD